MTTFSLIDERSGLRLAAGLTRADAIAQGERLGSVIFASRTAIWVRLAQHPAATLAASVHLAHHRWLNDEISDKGFYAACDAATEHYHHSSAHLAAKSTEKQA